MTKNEWDNLQINDEIIGHCVGCHCDRMGKIGTIYGIEKYDLSEKETYLVYIKWNDGDKTYYIWYSYNKINLTKEKQQQFNLFDGGASI
jgi:hypothetical protein